VSRYSLHVLKIAGATVPSYELYWMDSPGKSEPIVFTIGVLQGGGRTILINSGLPEDHRYLSDYWAAWYEPHRVVDFVSPMSALAALGVAPEAVTHILLTPLTAYTTGCLDRFPHAEIVLGRRGWVDFWAPEPTVHRLPRNIYFPDHVMAYVAGPGAARIRLLDDEAGEFLPGIRAWFAGGHHRSTMAYLVNTPAGTVGWCDGVFKYQNLEANRPLGITESLAETLGSYARLRREADLVIAPYDPELFTRHPQGRVA
jgi:hypothetical protein